MNTPLAIGTKVVVNKPQFANSHILGQGGHGLTGIILEILKSGVYVVKLGGNQQCYCKPEEVIV